MANVLMTREELFNRATEALRLSGRVLCVAALLDEMKPGEERLLPNPFGRDLIPILLRKPE
jgi:hypothetical protein